MKQFTSSLAVVLLGSGFAFAQYQVLYSFGTNGGANDGYIPNQGLVSDSSGNLYGTTGHGGVNCHGVNDTGCGTIFELSPSPGGGWIETVLWSFCTGGIQPFCPDGEYPEAGLIIDSAGNLYGTAENGGSEGSGVVFELSPPSVPSGAWMQTTLWSFPEAGPDIPSAPLLRDSSGNLYGTTSGEAGAVFELSPSLDGWSEQTLYAFSGNQDGATPYAGLAFDQSGNLYGTTAYGGGKGKGCGYYGCGTIFELSPQANGTWQETVLYRFTGKGAYPSSRLYIDQLDDLYGTVDGLRSAGGVFRFSSATGNIVGFGFNGIDGAGPDADILVKRDFGYGVTFGGGANAKGTIFQLHRNQETVLYNFCSQPTCADGESPAGGGSLLAAHGELYGTTTMGGTYNQGVVFVIKP